MTNHRMQHSHFRAHISSQRVFISILIEFILINYNYIPSSLCQHHTVQLWKEKDLLLYICWTRDFLEIPLLKACSNIMNHATFQSPFRWHFQWNKDIFWYYNTAHQFTLSSNQFRWSELKKGERLYESQNQKDPMNCLNSWKTNVAHTCVLLNISNNNLKEVMKCSFRFACDTKKLIPLRVKECWRNGANRSLTKFSKDKCKVLYLESTISYTVTGWEWSNFRQFCWKGPGDHSG